MPMQALEVRCAKCQYFVLKIWSFQAQLEVNCPSARCSTTLRVTVMDGRIALEAMPKKKKA